MSYPFDIRIASPGDVTELRAIDVEAWGEELAATEDMLLSRIAAYPCGNFLAVQRDTGEIMGSAWSISRKDEPVTTWAKTCGGGFYESACDMFGPVVFGVNASVRRKYAGAGTAQILISHGSGVAWDLGKKKVLFGSRIPEYGLWQKAFAASDYIRLAVAEGILYYQDPTSGVIRRGPSSEEAIQSGVRLCPSDWTAVTDVPNGMSQLDGELGYFLDIMVRGQKCSVFHELPEYFPDPDSCNYGVLIGWERKF